MVRALVLAFATLMALPVTAALAADYGQHRSPVYGDIPACDARAVLGQVAEKERYHGQRPYQDLVDVVEFDHVRQTRYVTPAYLGARERRWCEARAHLATGHTRTVYYLIESRASFVGVSYGVESCMAGRDLWNVHGGDCSALRLW